MLSIRLLDRSGGKARALALEAGRLLLQKGFHVQVFDEFAALRPGAPTYAILRVSRNPIRLRAEFNPKADVAVVLDPSLLAFTDIAAQATGPVYAVRSGDSVSPPNVLSFPGGSVTPEGLCGLVGDFELF